MNKDILYLISFVLILINYMLLTYDKFKIKNNLIVKTILLFIIVYVLNYNIYLGILTGMTYLSLNH